MTYVQYLKVVKLFENMKRVHGPQFVNYTLTRHVALRRKLIDFERIMLADLEEEILSDNSIAIKKQ